MTTITEMAEFLKKDIDWERMSKVITAIGADLNDRSNRFLKSKIIEKSVEKYSKSNSIKWVDNEGCDHEITINPSNPPDTCEQKFLDGAIYTGIKKQLKSSISIKLFNNNGNERSSLPSSYANFLLVIERFGAMIFHKSVFGNIKNLTFKKDGIICKLNTTDGILIAGKDTMLGDISKHTSILNEYNDADNRFLDSIM